MTNPLYILLRTDLLGMSPGRAAAQASHATSLFHEKMTTLNYFSKDVVHSRLISNYSTWKSEAGQFGTTIVLGASARELHELFNKSIEAKIKSLDMQSFYYSEIIDPEYYIKGPDELFKGQNILTGGVFFFVDPIYNEQVQSILEEIKTLQLY